MKRYFRCFLMVFLLSFINIVIAQKEQLRFEQISLEQGLSQTTVNCFLMDRNGFMWIGTCGGLNRYGFQSSILKTNNGGQHWAEIRFDKYLINDMYFDDSLHGWIVGQDTSDHGMILETYDSGDNWAVQIEGLSASLNALHFKDGFGWAVGGNGLILRTEDGSTWVDSQTGKTFPGKFSLSQNYPNPFNPTTNIQFSIPKTEFITCLGR